MQVGLFARFIAQHGTKPNNNLSPVRTLHNKNAFSVRECSAFHVTQCFGGLPFPRSCCGFMLPRETHPTGLQLDSYCWVSFLNPTYVLREKLKLLGVKLCREGRRKREEGKRKKEGKSREQVGTLHATSLLDSFLYHVRIISDKKTFSFLYCLSPLFTSTVGVRGGLTLEDTRLRTPSLFITIQPDMILLLTNFVTSK